MSSLFYRTGSFVVIVILLFNISIFSQHKQNESKEWWNIPYPNSFDGNKLKTTLSFVHVEGNHFVDEHGKIIIFKGVNISDPDKLVKNGIWSKKHF